MSIEKIFVKGYHIAEKSKLHEKKANEKINGRI